LNKVIDKVLNQMLGREATEVFYDHLRTTHSIQRDNLVQELDLFNHALREYLGSGAVIIEQVIHRNLELNEPEIGRDTDFLDKSRMLKLV